MPQKRCICDNFLLINCCNYFARGTECQGPENFAAFTPLDGGFVASFKRICTFLTHQKVLDGVTKYVKKSVIEGPKIGCCRGGRLQVLDRVIKKSRCRGGSPVADV